MLVSTGCSKEESGSPDIVYSVSDVFRFGRAGIRSGKSGDPDTFTIQNDYIKKHINEIWRRIYGQKVQGKMLMLKWNDYTDRFHEYERFWRGRYLELCEVAEEEIELNLYSCEDDDWEIYVSYGIMYGISYAPAEKAAAQREQMKEEIEEEYEKHGKNPSKEFISRFSETYRLEITL